DTSITLLLALVLTFSQFARLSAQEQIQKWRIALADAGNWDMLIMTWADARNNPVTKKLVSAQETVGLEIIILIFWTVGGASIVLAWLLSFF
ncbi:MAG: hypothetical protein KKH60_00130, partial [Proteobacteria bacterium]|nr:hypothetical protein [Pseudomonadota bacterium]